MTLTEQWKTAKGLFEDATNKKKPTEKFLGVFRKGTGIEAALKKADAAKTAADLRKALADFQKEATAYTKTLKTAAADPKSVKPEDKAAYILNTTKLETSLTKLMETGEGMAASLGGVDKKTKVDPALLKEETEMAAHLALRKKMTPTLNGVLSEYKKKSDEIQNALDKAIEYTAEAKTKKGVEARVAIGTVEQFQKQATDTMKTVQDDWAKHKANGSEMMTARGDMQNLLPKAWSPQKKQEYLKEAGTAFASFSAVQLKIQALVNQMELKIAEVNRMAEEADTYSGLGQDPKKFAARLAEIQKDLTEMNFWVEKKLGQIKNNYEKQKKDFDEKVDTKEVMLAGYTKYRNAEVTSQELTESKTQNFVAMVKRVQIIPTELRTDPLIDPAFKQFSQLAGKVKNDLIKAKKDQQDYVAFLNKCVVELSK